jgi:hypothetical protein
MMEGGDGEDGEGNRVLLATTKSKDQLLGLIGILQTSKKDCFLPCYSMEHILRIDETVILFAGQGEMLS